MSLSFKGASDSKRLGDLSGPVNGVEMVKGMDLREEYKYQTTLNMTLQLWVNLMKEKQESSKGKKEKAQQKTSNKFNCTCGADVYCGLDLDKMKDCAFTGKMIGKLTACHEKET